MDTNTIIDAEDAEMADCDGEKVVTMIDVLREQEDFENDANAVLGASDEKNCTYTKGYIKRQAIYACMTCCAEAKDDPTKRAGVCLACSLTCHENHELIELYTKRNFRCDCGNPKLNSNPCQYTSTKTDLNENNEYNQNFSGLYCVCKRPYPDPEATTEDEMIQCIVCEDWLHASHLEATLPPNDQYSEMICKSCMEKNLFLHDYSDLAVNVENDVVDVVSDNTESAVLNDDIKNDQVQMSEETSVVDIQETPAMLVQEETHAPENNDPNASVTSEVKESVSDSKTNLNIDAENIEEDRLLADPEEEKIEEPSNKKECVSEDNQMNKDIPEKQDSEVVTDTMSNKGDSLSKDTEGAMDTKTKECEIENDKDITENINPEIIKDNILDGISLTEQNESENKADEKQSSEKDKENEQSPENDAINNDTHVAEDKIQDASKTDLEGSNEESNIEENMKDSSTTKEDNNDDSKTDLKENNEENNVTHNMNDSSTTNKKDNDVEMKDEIDIATVNLNGSDGNTSDNKRKLSTDESANKVEDSSVGGKRVKLDCICSRPKNIKRVYKGATFWPSDFRQKLCTCNECLTMYKDLSVLFLTDLEDTVRAYENLGEEKDRIEGKPASQYEKGLQALSSLDRIQQINALTEYNKMRDKLVEFLQGFKDRRDVVKEEDIKEFFAGMKPKREPDGVYFCR